MAADGNATGGSGDTAASSTPSAPAPRKPGRKVDRVRLISLLVGLVILGGSALYLRYDALREWNLSRRSLAQLQPDASRANADPLTRLVYAEKLIAAGRSPEAIPILGDAVNTLPTNPRGPIPQRIYSRFGHALALAGYTEDAKQFLDLARRLDSDDARIYRGYALIFLSNKNADAALKQIEVANTLDPDNPEGWYLLGKTYNEQQKPESAIAPLKKAVALAPNFAPAQAELGHAYAFQAQFGPATEAFRKALALEPQNAGHRQALGAALGMGAKSREQYEEARKLIEDSIKEGRGNPQLSYTLGLLHLRFNNLEASRTLLNEAIKNQPDHAEAWYNLGLVEKRLGNNAAAATATATFQRLSKLHDERVVAEKKVASDLKNVAHRLALARAYRKSGNVVGAYWQMRVALQINPNQPAVEQEIAPIAREYMARRKKMGNQPDDPVEMGPPPPEAAQGANPAAGAPAGAAPPATGAPTPP